MPSVIDVPSECSSPRDDRLEAQRVGDEREADAGVARRALDDRAAGLQRAAAHGVLHDGEPRPVLDRAARIHELRLAENRAAGRLGGVPQLDERGVADCFDDGGRDHGDVLRAF